MRFLKATGERGLDKVEVEKRERGRGREQFPDQCERSLASNLAWSYNSAVITRPPNHLPFNDLTVFSASTRV